MGAIDIQSPFHQGEQKIQSMLGVRENMERFGRMVIRDHMPEQHREFYNQLPFVFVGHADREGNPWASILINPPGFIESPTNQLLAINTAPIVGDPLGKTLAENRSSGEVTRLGLLGIELMTRRRNRLSGHVLAEQSNGINLHIDQAFGNCPQYIQSREYQFIPNTEMAESTVQESVSLDAASINLIENADTFFIASYLESTTGNVSEGADVSHRGGRPGFVKVSAQNTLIFPDYLGNNHFNTLGNIEENGKAGLLFLDFEKGHMLTITGRAKILWDSPEQAFFDGAERLIEFTVEKSIWVSNALPLRWSDLEFSNNSLLTGTWQEAEEIKKVAQLRNQWTTYKVKEIVEESQDIRSFYLTNNEGLNPKFKPGQFLTIKAEVEGKEQIRTYTVSSAPDDEWIRLSIKRELPKTAGLPKGVFSNFMHDSISTNQKIIAKAPSGSFYFDPRGKKPAILMAAGVGITPMISMLRQSLIESIKTRYLRTITLIAVARNHKERAFYDELEMISGQSSQHINVIWFLTQPEIELEVGRDYDYLGRPDLQTLEIIIEDTNHQAYLCGPNAFMQNTYDDLRTLGIDNKNIFAESFGPSSLKRDDAIDNKNIAEQALITIENVEQQTLAEQHWDNTKDGSLLEFIESHGMTPSYGCRSGQCGACKSEIVSGVVENFIDSDLDLADNEVLLCCAKPAMTTEQLPALEIKLL